LWLTRYIKLHNLYLILLSIVRQKDCIVRWLEEADLSLCRLRILATYMYLQSMGRPRLRIEADSSLSEDDPPSS